MRTMTLLLALTIMMWPGIAAGQDARPRTIALRPIEGSGPGPELVALLPGLVEASLESGEGYEVGPITPATGWVLGLKVSGRGPWALSARASAEVGVVGHDRISIKKIPFADREGLVLAVDTLAAQLHAAWKTESTSGRQGAGEPVPLARALSSSPKAVDAYLRAIAALRSTDATEAAGLLDQALAVDPSFVMAAAQRARLELASGDFDRARDIAERAHPKTGTQHPALAADVIEAVRLVARDDAAGALSKADAMITGAPHLVWGRVLRALALGLAGRGKEAVNEWNLVVAAEPDDVAHRVWLGRALMATGDFKAAAEALGRARVAWPSNLILYTLQAESYARIREIEAARGVVIAMKDYMLRHDLTASGDALNPFLMLGSVELLEGRFTAGLASFEEALDIKSKSGGMFGPSATLHETIVEMRRDLVTSYDELTRRRQLDDIQKALQKFKDSLPPEESMRRETEFLRLEGLITLKRGDTVGAWKTVEEIRTRAGQPGYTAYDEAYLSAATTMKEDDPPGALSHFERAAQARGIFVDLMDLGQAQLGQLKYEDARANLEAIEKGLSIYAPSWRSRAATIAAVEKHDDLILADPHLAAMMPIYQYLRARLAFETGKGDESRRYFNRMLKYLRNPDEQFMSIVKEALGRGAKPE